MSHKDTTNLKRKGGEGVDNKLEKEALADSFIFPNSQIYKG